MDATFAVGSFVFLYLAIVCSSLDDTRSNVFQGATNCSASGDHGSRWCESKLQKHKPKVANLLLVLQNPVGVCNVKKCQVDDDQIQKLNPWIINHMWASRRMPVSNCNLNKVPAICLPISVDDILKETEDIYNWNTIWPEIYSDTDRHNEWDQYAQCARFSEGFSSSGVAESTNCTPAAEKYFSQMGKLYKSVAYDDLLKELGIILPNKYYKISDMGKPTVYLGCHQSKDNKEKCMLTRIGFCYRCSPCSATTNPRLPSCCAVDDKSLPGAQVNCFQVKGNETDVPWSKVDTDDVSCYHECEEVCYCGTDENCTCNL